MKTNTEKVFDYIVNYKKRHDGNSPSIREIGRGCGISSTSVVNYHLMKLEKRKKIKLFKKYMARSYRVVGGEWTIKK